MKNDQEYRALPRALVDLIEAFGILPGVGARTAERYAYASLKQSPAAAKKIAVALEKLHTKVKFCPITFALIDSDQEISPLYSDPIRDKKTIAVVEDPFDVVALEKTNQFKGTYHVLGGLISPIDGITPEQLHIPELVSRAISDNVTEIILATNASVEGESTALYIQKMLEEEQIQNLKITRLARGLPVGVDLEYADQITLGHALKGRREI